MATPVWNGATSGVRALAGQVNQLLGTHASTFVYTGLSVATQPTAGTGTTASNSLYIAQSFTTGTNTAVGRILLTVAVTGTPNPLTLTIQANASGIPSGTALVTTLVPPSLYTGSATSVSIPLPVTGLTASTTYWIVANAVGDASDFFAFSRSNQASGVSTSTNGTTWAAQTYGLIYSIFNQGTNGLMLHTWEDSNARWTGYTWNANGTLATVTEYTTAQNTATGTPQFVYSKRALTYSGTTPPVLVTVA